MTQEFVTLPRSVVEQALEALDAAMSGGKYPYKHRCSEAINTLREILEQPQVVEVVVTTNQQGQCVAVTRQDDEGQILSVIWQAKQQQVEQEPVAWIENLGGGISYSAHHEAARKLPEGVRFDLYTHSQPKREPLTEDEIDKLCPQYDDPMRREMWIIGFKATHGIK